MRVLNPGWSFFPLFCCFSVNRRARFQCHPTLSLRSLPAAAGHGGESQGRSSEEKRSPAVRDEAGTPPFAGAELDEDDFLDVVPPSPEEELPAFSSSATSIR